jgi:hypothetical protein
MISAKSWTLGGKSDSATTVLFSVSFNSHQILRNFFTSHTPFPFATGDSVRAGTITSWLVTVEILAIKPAIMLSIMQLS